MGSSKNLDSDTRYLIDFNISLIQFRFNIRPIDKKKNLIYKINVYIFLNYMRTYQSISYYVWKIIIIIIV